MLVRILLTTQISHGFTLTTTTPPPISSIQPRTSHPVPLLKGWSNEGGSDDATEHDDNDEWITAEISEVITNDGFELEDEEDWIPDREKARLRREAAYAYQARFNAQHNTVKEETTKKSAKEEQEDDARSTPYTEEEEEVIRSMGGKSEPTASASKRQPGYLGDSTLAEIAMDYSVPICYIADVLVVWGAAVPINVHDRLGDLVTGEQAFALLEAVNSLDVAALNERYSNQSLYQVCSDWDIDLKEGFEMALKEGWSLPFGVQTVLRVEQEEELLRVLGGYSFQRESGGINP